MSSSVKLDQVVGALSTKTKIKVITGDDQLLFSGYAYEFASTETLVNYGASDIHKIQKINDDIVITLD